MLLWLLSHIPLAAADDVVNGPVIQQVLSTYTAHASHPIPTLTDAQIVKLLTGKVIKMRLPSEGSAPDGAMVMVVTEMTRSELWLGTMDAEHFGTDSNLLIHHLPLIGDDLFRWYGFVDLPVPVSNRHFLVRTTINRRLPDVSGNTMWERSWKLEEGFVETMRPMVAAGEVPGIDASTFENAIAIPVNFGAWILLDLPDGRTLFGYHCATALGGEIPDSLVTRYVFWGLDELIERITDTARAMPEHYGTSHKPLIGGDGEPIPRF